MDSIKNVHPGEVLLGEFLVPMDITRYRLAKHIGVSHNRINDICAGDCSISADTALRLSRAFGTTPGFWLALQADYDREEAVHQYSETIARIRPIAT